MEERLESSEKEIPGLEEMIMGMCRSLDKLAEEVREGSSSRKLEESGSTEENNQKLKGKVGENEPGGSGGTQERGKYKRLEMPVFDGSNPESWVYRAEHYFDVQGLEEKEKVKVAVVSFAKDEVDWFRWSHNRKEITSWDELKSRLFEFFSETEEGGLGARLLRIRQEGTYQEYVKKFVTYSAPLPDLPESVMRDAFINGLKPTLRAEVISRGPTTLNECMKQAQWISDRNMALKLAWPEGGRRKEWAGKERSPKCKKKRYEPRKTLFQKRRVRCHQTNHDTSKRKFRKKRSSGETHVGCRISGSIEQGAVFQMQ